MLKRQKRTNFILKYSIKMFYRFTYMQEMLASRADATFWAQGRVFAVAATVSEKLGR